MKIHFDVHSTYFFSYIWICSLVVEWRLTSTQKESDEKTCTDTKENMSLIASEFRELIPNQTQKKSRCFRNKLFVFHKSLNEKYFKHLQEKGRTGSSD